MKKKYIIGLVCAAIIVVSTVAMVAIKNSMDKKEEVKVETLTIPAIDKVYINGKVMPTKVKNIFLDPTAGEIDSVSVKNGQNVKKGDVLFTYKNDKLDTQIDSLELQLKSAKSQKTTLLNQKKEMEKQAKEAEKQMEAMKKEQAAKGVAGATAMQQVPNMNMAAQVPSAGSIKTDSVDDQIELLESQIKNLKDAKYKKITATMAGKVILNGNEGNVQEPYIVIQSNEFYVDGSVNERDQQKLKKDQKADIDILASNKTVKGEIDAISTVPEAGAVSLNPKESQNMSFYKVTIDFDSQKDLVDGFHVQAYVNVDGKDITIPKTCVLKDGDNNYVYTVVDNKLKKVNVKVEDSKNKDEYIVKSGLNPEDKVVKNPDSSMKEGMEI